MKFFEEAKLKVGVILRERKERIAERKAARANAVPSQGAPLIWVWFLAIIAASTLIGSTWMLAVFIAGSVGSVDWAIDWRAGNDGQPSRWVWYAEATIHLIIGLGLACFCLGIAAFNAVWLHVRHYLQGLFLHVVTALGVATALFMVAGAIVTQQWGTDARTRDQVAEVGTAQAGVAAINAEITAIETEMARLCAPNLTTYQAQACRSGEIAWAERTETALRQNDAQLGGIERAMADARQGDRWRERLTLLRREAAVASVQTVEAETATVVSTGWMATFARVLEDVRKPFIAVLGELLAMTMFGVALAAWRSRQPYRVQSQQSGWAPEEVQIEDMRGQAKPAAQPMEPAREVVTDAETGEELIKVKPREYWKRRGARKGKPTQVDIEPEIPPDERGVAKDGGNRIAMTVGGPVDLDAPSAIPEQNVKENAEPEPSQEAHNEIGDVQSETSVIELPDDFSAELEPVEEQVQDEAQAADEQHGVEQDDADGREPETNPARMIAAE